MRSFEEIFELDEEEMTDLLGETPNALAKEDVKRCEKLQKKVDSGEMTPVAMLKRLDELRISAQNSRDNTRDSRGGQENSSASTGYNYFEYSK